jgi:alpha/beta superfamily hydrolase
LGIKGAHHQGLEQRQLPMEEMAHAGDDVVPLSAVLDWARPQSLPVIVVPGVGHFFHGQLPLLKSLVVRAFDPQKI